MTETIILILLASPVIILWCVATVKICLKRIDVTIRMAAVDEG